MASSRLEHLCRFYCLLGTLERKLGGARRLRDCSGPMLWPTRGIYFFHEPGEARTTSGTGSRIVRVGTHALKTGSRARLWDRLKQHRGSVRSGGGNHRGSIFRLIVGTALVKSEGLKCPTWDTCRGGVPRKIRERELKLEQAVSNVIGAMPFLWLAIEDEAGPASLRGYIERNSIALLSNHGKKAIDPPSRAWLGHHCDRGKVRAAGLWNSNHVDERYDPTFIDTLAGLIEQAGSHN